ncbi:4'-phosphopantetheinyl transferase superfamily protein [Pseudovibrio sp. Tun.PSC04-5.I4]|uniref:4'-phosphopantetheinyl transferase family protein n=1 Tax=Pseudovibrio sp. Tun.PSC04-5.I4 TaxID=1798213 RepID=UPI000AE6DB14|nr:4'-phosphopantetheinyl transferase superfamily protein [Pseudovibrio sp. Tun.PSC04-5.I4]
MTRYRFQRDKLAFALARHVTRKVLGADQPALAFSRHAKGKPFLPGFYPFNISHSGGLVAVAFAPPGPLGVDIEHMRHDSDVDDLVSVVCHSQERQFIAGITSKERVRSFYRCWTRKEALLKATGEGLRDDLSSIDVRLAETSPIINMGDQVRLIDVNVGWEAIAVVLLSLPIFRLRSYLSRWITPVLYPVADLQLRGCGPDGPLSGLNNDLPPQSPSFANQEGIQANAFGSWN